MYSAAFLSACILLKPAVGQRQGGTCCEPCALVAGRVVPEDAVGVAVASEVVDAFDVGAAAVLGRVVTEDAVYEGKGRD